MVLDRVLGLACIYWERGLWKGILKEKTFKEGSLWNYIIWSFLTKFNEKFIPDEVYDWVYRVFNFNWDWNSRSEVCLWLILGCVGIFFEGLNESSGGKRKFNEDSQDTKGQVFNEERK